jgi:hypothetical protein
MPRIKDGYWDFYLMGREERVAKYKRDIDLDALERQVKASDASMHQVILAECEQVCAPLRTAREQRKWVAVPGIASDIKEAGGDESAAYTAWCHGRIDELALVIERDLLDAMSPDDGDDEDEDEEDDEDED